MRMLAVVAVGCVGVALIVVAVTHGGDLLARGGPFMLGLLCLIAVASWAIRRHRNYR
jgi:hypothetical protein